ncbi:hypothetical protein [Micromonospora sp. KC606]|uniref:hypothetical protein n=1 Tax=Micromonospora sp. KC606 TaxID=2530379 RepID=UPI00140452DB|nr:hypothetical protein [Micromonospora sp. KC606]
MLTAIVLGAERPLDRSLMTFQDRIIDVTVAGLDADWTPVTRGAIGGRYIGVDEGESDLAFQNHGSGNG